MTFRQSPAESVAQRELLALVVAFVLLAGAFAALVPPFEAPDETGHLFYINFVARHLALPDQDDPARRVEGEGHQYPLYYILAAGIVRVTSADHSVDLLPRPNRVAGTPAPDGARPKFIHVGASIFAASSDRRLFYLLRAISIALGAATVLATWHLAGEIVHSTGERLLATAFVATLPQFAFISASINNDNLTNLLTTLALLFLLRLARSPNARNAGWLGVFLGLALAAKKSALFLLPVCLVVAVLLIARTGAARRVIARRLVLALAVAVLVSGWVFVRWAARYGDPLGSAMERRTLPELVEPKSLLDRYWLSPFLPWLGRSFVGVFGWMDVPLPGLVPLCYLLLAVTAVGRLLVNWVRPPAGAADSDRERRTALALGALAVAACFAGVVIYNLTYTQYQGRFLFPVLGVVGALFARGLGAAGARFAPGRWNEALGAFCVGVFIVADVVALLLVHSFYGPRSAYI